MFSGWCSWLGHFQMNFQYLFSGKMGVVDYQRGYLHCSLLGWLSFFFPKKRWIASAPFMHPESFELFYFLDKLESWSVSQGFNQSLERVDFPTGLETLELSSAFQVLPAKCNWAANAKVFKGNPWQVFADPSFVGNTASILDWRLFELNVECTFLFRSDSKDALVTLNPSFARYPY